MSSETIYLYLKTHNKTGLKYLGKTVQDPYDYRGSGKLWRRHIQKHGYDVKTEVLLETTDENAIREKGLYYSHLWNIVESDNFANLNLRWEMAALVSSQKNTEENSRKVSKNSGNRLIPPNVMPKFLRHSKVA